METLTLLQIAGLMIAVIVTAGVVWLEAYGLRRAYARLWRWMDRRMK